MWKTRSNVSVACLLVQRSTFADNMPADGSSGSASGVYTCSKLKLDSLFLRWFSLPESQELVRRFTCPPPPVVNLGVQLVQCFSDGIQIVHFYLNDIVHYAGASTLGEYQDWPGAPARSSSKCHHTISITFFDASNITQKRIFSDAV